MDNNFDNIKKQPETDRKKYLFYRILGGINNFVAIFFLFLTLMSFATIGLQSSLLLYFFVFIAILIYTNLTTVFARHVLVRGNYIRRRIKDWIRVNAIVALLFSGFMIVSILYVLNNHIFIEKMTELYSGMEGVTDEMIQQAIPVARGILIFFLLCMVILIIHVILSFRYIKRFADKFKDQDERPSQNEGFQA